MMMVVVAVRRVLLISWCLTRLGWVRLRLAKARLRLMWVQTLRVRRGRTVLVMRMPRRLLVWRLVLRGRVLEALQQMWRRLQVMLRGRLVRRATRRLLCRVRRLVHW